MERMSALHEYLETLRKVLIDLNLYDGDEFADDIGKAARSAAVRSVTKRLPDWRHYR